MDQNAKDKDGKLQWVCTECNSPCASCEDGADKCTACDGTRAR